MRRAGVAIALLLAAVFAAGSPAAADTTALRIMRPLDIDALPLVVMEHEHLIERAAQSMGLGSVTVTWAVPDKGGIPTTLGDGRADLAMVDLVPFLIAADAGPGAGTRLQAIGAVLQRPYVLVTRNKAVHTIRDFRDSDRIAVPALKVSGPAVMLEMAAAQEWGSAAYARLDPLVVARPDAVAADMLVYAKGAVDAHFSRSPVVDAELADPAVHRVMDSFDIAGPHSAAVLATTAGFANAHAELCKAVLKALGSADDFIRRTPGAAAEIFAGAVKDEDIPLEDLSDMIGDPDRVYRTAPFGVTQLAQFLQRIGRLKHRIDTWRQFFASATHDLPGS